MGNPATHVEMYFAKWVDVATGGRVHLTGLQAGGIGGAWYVFKCTSCQDNWHMASHQFSGTSVPSELQDWVIYHRHVCKDYLMRNAIVGSLCYSCGWPSSEHIKTYFDETSEKWVTVAELTPPEPKKLDPKTLVMPEAPTTRRFRD
jgi:hypothetical protein